ncbi:MAG: exodeoxyribonuclease V subunit alpha [Myxococcales bacterium]|nr:exodeoxyribonuclease V subunit alpha [Myxococcales bacterium]
MRDFPALCRTGTATETWRRIHTGERTPDAAWTAALSQHLQELDRPIDLVALSCELASLGAPPLQPALQLLILLTLLDLGEGATQTTLSDNISSRLAQIAPLDARGEQATQQALDLLHSPEAGAPVLSTTPQNPAPLLIHEGVLQLHRLYALERQLGAKILHLMESQAPDDPEEFPEAILQLNTHPLSDEQIAAVHAAAHQTFTVITGGPGTGKTSIVLALIRLLQHRGLPLQDMVLAAPTGKATRRLAESVERLGTEAKQLRIQTLHRLLGATPGRNQFIYHRDHPLPVRLVIIDEASMLDLELTARLMDAISANTQVILLGDAEQIPSVDPGSVLSDLTKTLPTGVVHQLKKSFRMNPKNPAGRRVLLAAQAIQRGDSQAFFKQAEAAPLPSGAQPVQFVSLLDAHARQNYLRSYLEQSLLGQQTVQQQVRTVFSWVEGSFPNEQSTVVATFFQQMQTSQLLTITRNPYFATSSDAMNARLHALYAQAMDWPESLSFLPGEPILVLQNDYQRRIYNGDVGLVLKVAVDRRAAESMAVFPGETGWMIFELDALRDHLSLAHAMTVHKAQGSEYERVSLILPEADLPLLTREIIYTAITRARHEVQVVGSKELLTRGLRRQASRISGLSKHLSTEIHQQ